ncbi:hypothetical protein GQ53DRAFT_458104 [Thozetella sp. PMI_491]|nr:hypothetical protein GQ53DRAFT_458104 [Thozetella sp. PMI_491]
MAPEIPLIYRIVFKFYEPFSSAVGACTALFAHDVWLNNFIPSAMSVRNPQHDMLFNQVAAGFSHVAVSQALFFWSSNDVKSWKMLNGSLIVWDFILLYSYWAALSAQGRLDPTGWRSEDWTSVVITIFITLNRMAFVAGVGLDGKKSRAKIN